MVSSSWKLLEGNIALQLGGIRIHRGGDFSESLPDVIAPADYTFKGCNNTHAIIAEAKYRANQPWMNKYKALMACHKGYDFIIMKLRCVNKLTKLEDNLYITPIENLKDFTKTSNKIIYINKKVPDYLVQYCTQPREYILDPDIRDSIQLLYYKSSKDRARPQFRSYTSIAVIGQKHMKLRLACFFETEMKFLDAQGNGLV